MRGSPPWTLGETTLQWFARSLRVSASPRETVFWPPDLDRPATGHLEGPPVTDFPRRERQVGNLPPAKIPCSHAQTSNFQWGTALCRLLFWQELAPLPPTLNAWSVGMILDHESINDCVRPWLVFGTQNGGRHSIIDPAAKAPPFVGRGKNRTEIDHNVRVRVT